MLSEELKTLIETVIADGEVSDKEREVLHKRAIAEGEDPDEIDILVDGKIAKMKKEQMSAQAAQAPRPHSDKKGTIHKCPNCGAIVAATDVKCPECGYEFSGIEANNSTQRLSSMILDARQRHKNEKHSVIKQTIGYDSETSEILSIIQTFPIPTTKENLLEFLTSLKRYDKSNIEINITATENPLIERAYRTKYQECVEKAKVFFADDPAFKPFIEKKKGLFGKLFGK